MSVFRDEKGNVSMARVAVAYWLALCGYAVAAALHGARPDNAVWAVLSGVAVALVSWAAGPRIAQYLAPQAGATAQAAAQALRAKIEARRKAGAADGTEPTE